MPVIARFYGIVVKMYFSQSEHGVPHFHAIARTGMILPWSAFRESNRPR